MKQYVVKVDIGYKHIEFVFNTIQGACNFMELFLDHATVDEDGREVSVYMERVNIDVNAEESEDE